jgi:hypothetical protein
VHAVSYPILKTTSDGIRMKKEEIEFQDLIDSLIDETEFSDFFENGISGIDLQTRATIAYTDFQKSLDLDGLISDFSWFRYHNLFLGMQDEARNLLFYREA